MSCFPKEENIEVRDFPWLLCWDAYGQMLCYAIPHG